MFGDKSYNIFIGLDHCLRIKYINKLGTDIFSKTNQPLIGLPITSLLSHSQDFFEEPIEKTSIFTVTIHNKERKMVAALFPYESDFILLMKDITSQYTIDKMMNENQDFQGIINEITKDLIFSKEPKELLDNLFGKLASLLDIDTYFNYLINPENLELNLINYKGISKETASRIQTLQYGESVCGYVALTAQRLVVNHLARSEDSRETYIKNLGITAYVCHPLFVGEKILGTLSFGSKTKSSFSSDELELIQQVCKQVSRVLVKMLMIEDLKYKNHSLENTVKEKEELEALSVSYNNQFHEVFHASKDAMFITSLDNGQTPYFFKVNQAAIKMLGYSEEEFKTLSPIDLVDPDFGKIHDNVCEEITEGNKLTIEFGWIKKNKEKLPVELSISHYIFQGKTYYLTIARDLSERKAFEKSLIDAKNAAERANFAKSKFLSMMSHEMRTPLNSILGYSQILELKAEGLPLKHIEKIKNASIHLTMLINDILDYVGIEEGTTTILQEPVNLLTSVQDSMNMISAAAEMKNIIVTSNIHTARPVYIYGDALRLKQIILNLLSNAVKYSNPSEVVTIVYKELDNKVRVEIRDQGMGIHKKDLKKIFQPFFRSDRVLNLTEGRGLGLSLVKEFTMQMNGTCGVDSEVDNGSLFWVEFPKIANDINSPLKLPCHSEQNNTQVSVLYIEDHADNRQLMKDQFQLFKEIELHTAPDGPAGLELLNNHSFDLILLDINLPVMNGLKVCHLIRALPGYESTPIIAVSANALKEDIEATLQMGFDDYMVKPIDVHQLKAKMNIALNKNKINMYE
ncbi:PAS domain S-box-containing protein [Bacillus ectoiniformans]|uniref:ATP-binding protein n=1 Tax=Bacillus ectoiniformans TaxID=1494429 RepID=UPI00195DC891|nr:ATP-binding protein [Bacillus ectoiniformans]MBM7649776.1 PAS domain S-box-containing protein [Bacillus ectoiniformans]